MAEYIEREAAIAALIAAPKLYGYQDEGRKLIDIYDAVRILPAADVVPVVRGKWTRLDMHKGIEQFWCSICRSECYVPTCMGEPMYEFCPNCGARMDGDENG